MTTLSFTVASCALLLIGGFFVFFGCWTIYHWSRILKTLSEKNIPHPYLFLAVGIAWEIIAGGMILFHFLIGLGAALLVPFVFLSAGLFHPFWQFKGESRYLHFTLFMMYMTVILGALMLIMVYSPLTSFL